MSAIPDSPHKIQGESLQARFEAVRQQSLKLCVPLETEDYQVQPMDDASPPKWHLAHVTWFFETFLLKPFLPGYQPVDDAYEVLFNSYYNGVGVPFTRADRGNLSRPTLNEVLDFRAHVDEKMQTLLDMTLGPDQLFRIEVGLNHEQQHQELILTDLKYNLGNNPLAPAYVNTRVPRSVAGSLNWHRIDGGLVEIGAAGDQGYVFDNETPLHKMYLESYELASRPVTSGEFIEFIEGGGYENAALWLSDGWSHLNQLGAQRWQVPLYWQVRDGDYYEYTLSGLRKVDRDAPVCHVSAYEADAYARWRGCRLPTEAEWEHAARCAGQSGHFVEDEHYHPVLTDTGTSLGSMLGDVWEWTSSSYGPYPGYRPFPGQLGEYNGKFMANQLVLRGGSCATPRSHIRSTYRNFFYPPDRWQFSGIRLARDVA